MVEIEDDRDNNLETEGEEAGNLAYNGQCVVDDVENRVLTIENRVRDHPAFVSKKLTIKEAVHKNAVSKLLIFFPSQYVN